MYISQYMYTFTHIVLIWLNRLLNMMLDKEEAGGIFQNTKSSERCSEQELSSKNVYSFNTTLAKKTECCGLQGDETVCEAASTRTDFYAEAFNNYWKIDVFEAYSDVDAIHENVDPVDNWHTNEEIKKSDVIGNVRQEAVVKIRKDLPRMQYLTIKELIDSEETYIRNMKHVIENYLNYFRKLEISPNIEKVFGNIEELYEETQRTYNKMRECNSVEEVATLFLDSVHLFECYTKYLRNKSDSHLYATRAFGQLIKDRQIELNEEYTFQSYLSNPVQRPGRYKLLLQRLEETVDVNSQQCEIVKGAIQFIDHKIMEANTMMVIDSIQYCPIDLRKKGSYLLKDTFIIREKYESEVVLFEKCVVFCKADENNSNLYHYDEHIEMDKLSLRYYPKSLKFQLSSFDKIRNQFDKAQYKIDLEAPLMDIKEKWTNEIHRILWDQLQYYKDLQAKENLTRQHSRSSEIRSIENNFQEEFRYYDTEGIVYKHSSELIGTFFDKDKNLRIQLLRSDSQVRHIIHMPNVPEKQQLIINDLIKTEKVYIKELETTIDIYQSYYEGMDLPSYMLENIKDIHLLTEKLFSKFMECHSINCFAKVFSDNIRMFDSYKEYIWNRETFYRYTNTNFENIKSYIVNRRVEANSEQACNIDLLNPLGRLEKYKQTLEELENELSRTGVVNIFLNDVVALVNGQMGEIHTLIAINSIRCCPINLRKMGRFIMKEAFKTKYKYNKVIFLFEEVIIFCIEDQNGPNTYTYADSIQVRKLSIVYSSNSTSFKLRNLNQSKEDNKYTFTINASSVSTKEKWIYAIKKLLWGQLEYYKEKETDINKSCGDKTKGSDETKRDSIRIKKNGEVKKKGTVKNSKIDTRKHYSRFYYNV